MKRRFLLTPLISLCLGAAAGAATINIDLDNDDLHTFTGTGVLGGGLWNSVNSNNASGLLNSAGGASSIVYTLANGGSFDAPDGGNTPAGTANDLLRDYRYTDNNNGNTLTLTGLSPGALYDLVIYAAGDATNQGVTFSGALTGSTSAAQRDTFAENVNYVRGIVTADGSGTLVINMAGNGSQYTPLNGLQISDVPEPGAALLGALGSVIFLLRRRNQR